MNAPPGREFNVRALQLRHARERDGTLLAGLGIHSLSVENRGCRIRDEHAGAGLLAVIPLAVDTARDKGCKW